MKVENATLIVVTAPAHAPGRVDVIVKKKRDETAPDPADADGAHGVDTKKKSDEPRIVGKGSYWYLAAPLSVTTVTPNSGIVTGGTAVNIIGTGFVEGTEEFEKAKVSFGGTQSETVAVDSATSITASLPAHSAGKVDVVVVNGDEHETIKGDAFTYKCPGLADAYMLLMIVCVGALGGSLHAMRSLAEYVGARQLKQSWLLYYIQLPFTSAMIALVFYLIIRAGFYSPESATADTAAIMLGLAGLVGLFSEAAVEKLKKIAVALLTEPEQRPDKIEEVPSPDLQQVTPPKGSTQGGESVKLGGRGFSDKAEVTFDGIKATVDSRTGDASITVTTPPHAAGRVDVEVVNSGDKKSKLSGGFTYEAPGEQPPVEVLEQPAALGLQQLTPPKGSTQGGESVKLEGRGFSDKAEVTFDGIKATVDSRTGDVSITVTTPAHAAGPVDVEVVNSGDKKSKLSGGFTYEAPGEQPPVEAPEQPAALGLQQLSPPKGSTQGGDSVKLEGHGFSNNAEVTFDGQKATVVSRTDASITVTTPPHAAGPVDVEVLNSSDKKSKLSSGFTYEDPEQPAATTSPTITGVTPKSGPTSGNTAVTIDGTGFDAKKVQFGGRDANVVAASAASISVTTPRHDDPGSVDIVVTNNDDKTVKLESGFTYE